MVVRRRQKAGHILGLAAVGVTLFALGPAAAVGEEVVSSGDSLSVPAPELPSEVSSEVWGKICLDRAVAAHTRGDRLGVLRSLRSCDLSTRDSFPEADRAALLLAVSYLRLGRIGEFAELAETVSSWGSSSIATDWIQNQRSLLIANGASENAPGAEGQLADLLLAAVHLGRGDQERAKSWIDGAVRDGSEESVVAQKLRIYIEATVAGANESANALWEELARATLGPESHPLEVELAAIASLRLSVEDPNWLSRIGPQSRLWSRARIVEAIGLWENDDRDSARTKLGSLLAGNLTATDRREVTFRLASWDVEESRWSDAEVWLREVEFSHAKALESLEDIWFDRNAKEIWTSWERSGFEDSRAAIWVLDASIFEPAFFSTADAATRTRDGAIYQEPGAAVGWLAPANDVTYKHWIDQVQVPSLESLQSVAEMEADVWEAYAQLEETRDRIIRRREEVERERRYLIHGFDEVAVRVDSLETARTELLALRDEVSRLLAELEGVRDRWIDRVLTRTSQIHDRVEHHRQQMAAFDEFYVEDDAILRPYHPHPPSVPTGRVLLESEDTSSLEIGEFASAYGDSVAEQIGRSFEEIWKPRLIEEPNRLLAYVEQLLVRGRGIEEALGHQVELLERDELLADLHETAQSEAAHADSMASLLAEHREGTVRHAIGVAKDRLLHEGEAIAYLAGLVDYERVVSNLGTGVDSVQLQRTTERHRQFLADYEDSPGRPEVRYRLADLLMIESKHQFQARMETFLDQSEPTGVVPILEYEAALQQYQVLLEDAPSFGHRDAVLYHVGILLADSGDPAAMAPLEELVATFPESEFAQESFLRMGDLHFDDQRNEEAVALFERAALGDEPELTVIALYKTGWAHYNEDRFQPAADAFRRVLDVYGSSAGADAGLETDLRHESEDYLVHALTRGGGGREVAAYFDQIGPRPYEMRVLTSVAQLLRRFSLFEDAIVTERILLDRFAEDPEALATARRIVETHELAGETGGARAARLELAERFLPGSPWSEANDSDRATADAKTFSKESIRSVALFHHHRAREIGKADPENGAVDWQRARDLYVRLIALWPKDTDVARFHFYGGEAAAQLGKLPEAFEHFGHAAKADTASFALEAEWQQLAVLDLWYEGAPTEELGRKFLDLGQRFAELHPYDPRTADLAWRLAVVAQRHQWDEDAAGRFGEFARLHRSDARAPTAFALQGDALYRLERFDEAGYAYEQAFLMAGSAGDDSLAVRVGAAIPVSYFKHAEQTESAPAYETVAMRWPDFEHAHFALYRAGLGYRASGDVDRAVAAFDRITRMYADSEYARDAYLQIATAWKEAKYPRRSALAYERFSEEFPDDSESGVALLAAADLLGDHGDDPGATRLRVRYVDRYPEDRETALEVLHPMAVSDLERVGPGFPVARVLEKRNGADSPLTRYLGYAAAAPELADPVIGARVAFSRGESILHDYNAMRLTQPLKSSIEAKKATLEELLVPYRDCVERATAPWSQAAAFRIGEALVGFGLSLQESERPHELTEDDRVAYDEVLDEQAWEFFDSGEQVWADVLQSIDPALEAEDEGGWVERTRVSLWPRVPLRFVHFAEFEHPVVVATPPLLTEVKNAD